MDDPKPPQTPEEAIKAIRAAVTEGRIKFGRDTITAEYDDEIQRIFVAVRRVILGREPPRGLWTADGEHIGNVLEKDPVTHDYSPKSYAACEQASKELGITITPRTVWEDAGAALRSLDSTQVRS